MKPTQFVLEETDRLEKSPRDETWVFQYYWGKTPESLVNKPKVSKLRKSKWKVNAVLIFLFDIEVIIDYAFGRFFTTDELAKLYTLKSRNFQARFVEVTRLLA